MIPEFILKFSHESLLKLWCALEDAQRRLGFPAWIPEIAYRWSLGPELLLVRRCDPSGKYVIGKQAILKVEESTTPPTRVFY